MVIFVTKSQVAQMLWMSWENTPMINPSTFLYRQVQRRFHIFIFRHNLLGCPKNYMSYIMLKMKKLILSLGSVSTWTVLNWKVIHSKIFEMNENANLILTENTVEPHLAEHPWDQVQMFAQVGYHLHLHYSSLLYLRLVTPRRNFKMGSPLSTGVPVLTV